MDYVTVPPQGGDTPGVTGLPGRVPFFDCPTLWIATLPVPVEINLLVTGSIFLAFDAFLMPFS